MPGPLLYDPRYHTFESWASLMSEQYSANQVAIPMADTDWHDWGNGLKAIDLFSDEAIPSTEGFENWYDWAEALLAAINPRVG